MVGLGVGLCVERMVGPAVDFLLFEVLEETFTAGIIVRISLL